MGIVVNIEKITDTKLMDRACQFTIDTKIDTKPRGVNPSSLYRCEHSPIRTQMFWIEMINIPTFVSVHFVRHKIGVEHYVKSNREDRPGFTGDIGRNQPVNHAMFCNAQSLIHMARRRLCFSAHIETVKLMYLIRRRIKDIDPWLYPYLVPECHYRNGYCPEIKPCKYQKRMLDIS